MRSMAGELLVFIVALTLGVSVAWTCTEGVRALWGYVQGLDLWLRLTINVGLVTPLLLSALIMLELIFGVKNKTK